MTRVALIYFNAGGGHRAAAQALEASLRARHPRWSIQVTNLFDIVDPTGQFKRVARMAPEDFYNFRLAKGWTAGLAQELKVLQATLRVAHATLVRRIVPYWEQTRPDLVVSVIPNFNRVLIESLNRALPGVPYVTVMTDLADHPPNFWIEQATAQHIVVGTDKALMQARAMGCRPDRIHRVSGMVLRPQFYEPIDSSVAADRMAFGLDSQRPVGLVLFGGHGSAAMVTIAKALRHHQLILLCGHNHTLAETTKGLDPAARHVVLGFTREVRSFMRMADFFIGKPGPGSLSEAVHMGLPVITFRNAWTMPQERYNTEWVENHGFGVVVKSPRGVTAAVERLLEALPAYKARVANCQIRAVFEIPELLAGIVEQSVAQPRALPAPVQPQVPVIAPA